MQKETELKSTDPQCRGLTSVKRILRVPVVAGIRKKWEIQNYMC